MAGALKENSGPVMLSLGLHAAIAVALVLTALTSTDHMTSEHPVAPVNAVVVDSQVLKTFQRAEADRAAAAAAAVIQAREAEQAKAAAAEAQQARIAAEAKAATEAQAAAEAKAADEAQAAAAAQAATKAAEQSRLAQQARAQAEARAAAARAADEAERRAAEKRAADAKAAQEAKAAETRRLADNQAKADREAELKRQIAEEEHVDAVEASPLRDRYIASLQNRIEHAWIKPPSARVGIDCRVQVTQVPGGEVTSAHVTRCNGDAAVRQSIENAVNRASPLPDPPDPALFQRNFEIEFKPDE
jgi:colicin import membrane protein